MSEFDRKNRSFYSELTDEEKKKFSNYLMIRWGSAVQGSRELQEFYLISTNERFNKNFFAINRHPQLQWLCATAVSPGMGAHRHQWIASKKKEPGAGGIRKQLAELYPNMKADEIELMAVINNKRDIDDYVKLMGREK
jgi:hypothetical protein